MYSDNIKRVIRELGWTNERLAAEMPGRNGEKGITQGAFSQIINGNPTIGKLHEIAEIVGVPLEDLISGKTGKDTTIKCPHCGGPIHVSFSAE